MPNKNSLGKSLLILFVVTYGFIYSAPNLYPPDPAIQLSGESGSMVIDDAVLNQAQNALDEAGIKYFAGESYGESVLIRLRERDDQLRGKELIQAELGGDFIVWGLFLYIVFQEGMHGSGEVLGKTVGSVGGCGFDRLAICNVQSREDFHVIFFFCNILWTCATLVKLLDAFLRIGYWLGR